MDIPEQRKQHLEELINRSIEYRGQVIHISTLIEKDIEIIIVMYFKMSIDREVEFMELVLDRMQYDAKIAILEQIFKKKYHETYDKDCSKTISLLREIKEVRNKFAHDAVFTNYGKNDKIPKEFSLVNFRNNMTLKDFTKGDFKVFNEKSIKCKKSINKFLQDFLD